MKPSGSTWLFATEVPINMVPRNEVPAIVMAWLRNRPTMPSAGERVHAFGGGPSSKTSTPSPASGRASRSSTPWCACTASTRTPSPRSPPSSASCKNVFLSTDAMPLIACQLQAASGQHDAVTPTTIDLDVFSMIELVEARDQRLVDSDGLWFGNYETPCILSRVGLEKKRRGDPVDASTYGRKSSEGKDFNEDTNFGKLKRLPHSGLQAFLRRCSRIATGR